MAGTKLAFSKVVATPTDLAWSQAYSAGSLFAAISLQSPTPAQTEEDGLGNVGKDLISTLESEFFTLENKDLESIKKAIETTFTRVDENILTSYVLCFLNDNILYLYASGGGKAILKRGEKIGTVLEGEDGNTIKSASGYVQDKDVLVLQTKQFLRIIPSSTLAASLDKQSPEEITEELAPHVHDKSEGGASAVVLTYNEAGISEEEAETLSEAAVGVTVGSTTAAGATPTTSPDVSEDLNESTEEITEATETVPEEETTEEISEIVKSSEAEDAPVENPLPETTQSPETASPFLTDQPSKRRMSAGFGLGRLRRMPKGRRLILIIGAILVILLLIISVFAIVNMQNSNNEELFNGIYNEAREKYEEGMSLKDLNESLAQENFRGAQAILQKNVDTFPQGSSEDEQIEALLAQVNSQLRGSSGGGTTTSSQAQEVDKSESQILSVAIDNPNASYFTQNEDFIFFIDNNGVNRLDKGNSQEEEIIESDWEEEGGIGVFGSNIYVLDKTENIFKFVPSGEKFTKSNYITSDDPDLSNSAAMAIDGSIYVLDTSGNIQKYTKGAEEEFSITGLEKSMSGPTRIVTGEDFENIYVLDKGNSRIVVLDKEGNFVKAYSADILKNARDIDPQEAENAIFVLSGGKVYKIATN